MRPDEIFDAIHRIAIGKEPADANLRRNARTLLIALGVHPKTIDEATDKIRGAQQTTKALTNTAMEAIELIPDQSAQKKVQDALRVVTDRLNAAEKAVATQILSAAKAMSAAYQKFQFWTEKGQERAQQWFTMHTRIWTVIFAIIAAFGLQLDTVEIFKLVSSNKAVREKLVGQASAMSSQAEKILGDSPSILQSAYDTWLRSVDGSTRQALESAHIKITTTDTRESVIREIQNALAKIDKNVRDVALKSFSETVDKTVTDNLKDKSHDYAKVQADFDNTGFALFPKDGCFWRGSRWSGGWSVAHFFGVLFSVGLLSLGAPFWYNALKNLTSLRSTVAQNISKEEEQAQKQPPGAAPPRAPPTVKL